MKLNYEPEETKLAQLRELVRMAEENIGVMRDRLEQCEDIAKAVMKDLTRRLDFLEKMVHASLADVVFVAGSAGVRSSDPNMPLSEQKKARIQKSMAHLRTAGAVDLVSAGGALPRMDLVLEHLTYRSSAEDSPAAVSSRSSPKVAATGMRRSISNISGGQAVVSPAGSGFRRSQSAGLDRLGSTDGVKKEGTIRRASSMFVRKQPYERPG